ncbi:hypothetical protein I3842_02G139000 [Carya illinoinensis]|uniref:Uncharacterized protein n=1 Tax=Carya illinoinensis TaxID=32201 RepID=A0A922FVY3_CARIL|nr:hypothetical protein I3842_02G139000 [Carya illinoinensis]KAG6727729.1 hypothetical protein I3842_02G139000 [Carya illinoinensis]
MEMLCRINYSRNNNEKTSNHPIRIPFKIFPLPRQRFPSSARLHHSVQPPATPSTQRSVPASSICDSIVSWRKVLDPRSASTVSRENAVQKMEDDLLLQA